MANDTAARFGLAPDVPAKLVAAAMRDVPAAGSVSGAVKLAAAELGIEEHVALQLAAIARQQFDTRTG